MTRIPPTISDIWTLRRRKSSSRRRCVYASITGEVSQKEVTAVFVRETDHINYLTIEDEEGNLQTLEVTDAHPFWVVTDEPDLERAASDYSDGLYHGNMEPGLNGYWVEAKDLCEGDIFLGANGELLTFVSMERVEFPDGITVYNFTVDGNHNYFVIAENDEFGQTCVLVHNAGGEPWDAADYVRASKRIASNVWEGTKYAVVKAKELNHAIIDFLKEAAAKYE